MDLIVSEKTLSYDGYLGSIEVSLDDGCLFGRVLHINDLVTYEGQTVFDLKEAFENAVKSYLDACKRNNKEPNKTYSGTFNVRVGADIHKAAVIYGSRKGISLNEVVAEALKEKVYQRVIGRVEDSRHMPRTRPIRIINAGSYGAISAYVGRESWLRQTKKAV